jgi:hypothetical protein
MKCKICGKDSGKFVVCYKHRTTKYKAKCKIHGTTWFIGRQCQKCAELKKPIYEIKNNKDRLGNAIKKGHYLYPYLNRLTHKTRAYQRKYIQRISHSSGIYGIFCGNVCLYVGQSVDISTRIKQHKENFIKAQKQLQGIRIRKKRVALDKVKKKVEYKYYLLAHDYKLSDLSFKKLMAVPKIKDDFEYNELLTYAEQAMIDSYKPKYNYIAARPTKK